MDSKPQFNSYSNALVIGIYHIAGAERHILKSLPYPYKNDTFTRIYHIGCIPFKRGSNSKMIQLRKFILLTSPPTKVKNML